MDKASNNFGIVCKSFYLEVIKNELGISDDGNIIGNTVYKPTVKPLTSSHPKCCVKVASQKGWPLMRGGHCAIIGTHVLVCVGRYAWFCVM